MGGVVSYYVDIVMRVQGNGDPMRVHILFYDQLLRFLSRYFLFLSIFISTSVMLPDCLTD